MAAQARNETIRVPAIETTTAFQIQYAPGGSQTWTAYNPGSGSDILVSELVDGYYTLDGVNGGGNSETASQEGNWYQVRLKSGSLYGMWSAPFRIGAPTAQDFLLRLTGMGISAGAVDLDAAAQGAFDLFQTETGRVMLATAETRYFDLPSAPSAVIDLKADLYDAPSSVLVGANPYTLNQGYRPLDQNAFAKGKPYWALQLWCVLPGPVTVPWWNAVTVTGLWGYGLTIPNDAFEGIISLGMLRLLPDLGISATGIFNKWSEAEVTEDYGPETYGKTMDRLQKQADAMIAKYRRMQVGIGG